MSTSTPSTATAEPDDPPQLVRFRGHWGLLVGPPVAAFGLSELLLFFAAALSGDAGQFFSPALWARYDSGLYLQIAAKGYTLARCTLPQYPPHSWCGNAGWAPLYPWLISMVGRLGITLPDAGMLLAVFFAFLTLVAMWLLIGPKWSFSALACLALAACFPGLVYDFALFPVSLVALLSIGGLLALARGRYTIAGLFGAASAWAFATGVLMAPVAFAFTVLVRGQARTFWTWLNWTVRGAGIAGAGFIAMLVGFQIWVGKWSAYFAVEAKYGNGLHDPVRTFIMAFTGGPPALYPLQDPNPGYTYVVPQAQTAFVAALVLMTVIVAWRHRPVSRTTYAIMAYTVVVWIMPLVAGPSLSRYRLEALLVPCAALCKNLPRPVQVGGVVIAAILAVGLAELFFENKLI